MPVSVWLVAPVISTWVKVPGSPMPSKFTALLWLVRPRSRVGRCATALDEHLHRAADEPLRALVGVALDDLDEALHPLHLHVVRHDALRELGGFGVPARAEDERERGVELHGLADLQRLLEVLLRLAGEADDDVGRQGDVGDAGADHLDAVEESLARVGAAHRLQDAAAAGLERQVDVLADRVELSVHVDDVLLDVLRVRRGVAHATNAGIDPTSRSSSAKSRGSGRRSRP